MKYLIGGIIWTFPPIDLDTKNVQSFDRRFYQNISSNQFRHQKCWNFGLKWSSEHFSDRIGYRKYSKFWSEDFPKHFLQTNSAPGIFELLIGAVIRTFPVTVLDTKSIQSLIGGCIATFPPMKLGTKYIQFIHWGNH